MRSISCAVILSGAPAMGEGGAGAQSKLPKAGRGGNTATQPGATRTAAAFERTAHFPPCDQWTLAADGSSSHGSEHALWK